MAAPGQFSLLTPPAAEPVTLAEAKAHARVEHDAEDDLVSALIVAARRHVEQKCGLALITQTWSATFDAWDARGLKLRPYPVSAISAVKVWDGAALTAQTLSNYLLLTRRPATIVLANESVATPAPLRAHAGVEITFTAGYGDNGATVPDELKLAMKQLVTHWYENREPTPVSQNLSVVGTIAHQVNALIEPFRSVRIA